MATYRLSDAGMTGIVRKARRQSSVTTGLVFVVVLAVLALRSPDFSLPVFAAVFGVFLLLFLWIQRRSAAQAKRLVQSVTIEIDDHELKQNNSLVLTTIRREDVVELRYLPSGIMVLGRDRRHRIFLNRELDQFDDIARRIEEWAPANAVRQTAKSPRSVNYLQYGVTLGSLGFFFAASLAENPKIAIPCCLVESAFLLACVVWILTYKGVASRLKWLTVLVIPLAFVFLQKAYTLWKQP